MLGYHAFTDTLCSAFPVGPTRRNCIRTTTHTQTLYTPDVRCLQHPYKTLDPPQLCRTTQLLMHTYMENTGKECNSLKIKESRERLCSNLSECKGQVRVRISPQVQHSSVHWLVVQHTALGGLTGPACLSLSQGLHDMQKSGRNQLWNWAVQNLAASVQVFVGPSSLLGQKLWSKIELK